MKNKIRVILIEDDVDLRESLADFLNLSSFEVSSADCALEFYRILNKKEFDIAIIDIGLPDQSGLVLAEFARNNTAMGIIMVSAFDTDADQVRGYETGADLYMTKPVDNKVLASALISLCKRKQQRIESKDLTSQTNAWRLQGNDWLLITPQGEKIELTAKEFQFFEILALQADLSVTRKEIIWKLYKREDDFSSRALDALVSRLRQKIKKQSNMSSPIKTIHAYGYRFASPLLSR